MTKREPLRPEVIECALCGKRIGRFSKTYTIPDVEGDVCRQCDHDSRLVAYSDERAERFVRERRRAGVRDDRILPELRNYMHPPTHARYWENAGAWNALDVTDLATRHLNWGM